MVFLYNKVVVYDVSPLCQRAGGPRPEKIFTKDN